MLLHPSCWPAAPSRCWTRLMARACNTSAPPAANQDAAITADTELSDNPRRGAAGTSSKAVALGALPRHAANGPVGFPIDTYRSYGPRPCDLRPVFPGRDVRPPRFELRTRRRVGRTGPRPVKRIHGSVCELTTDRMSTHNSPPNMGELQAPQHLCRGADRTRGGFALPARTRLLSRP